MYVCMQGLIHSPSDITAIVGRYQRPIRPSLGWDIGPGRGRGLGLVNLGDVEGVVGV